jgi:hypothetical protein
MTVYINDNGSWRTVISSGLSVNDNGTWRSIQNGYVNDNGTWREVFQSIPTVTARTLITSTTTVNKYFTGRIYMVGAAGSNSRDGGTAGYGGIVIVDVVNAYIGVCIPGPGGGGSRSDGRMTGGSHPTGGPGISGCASSVAWFDGTEFLIAGAGGGVGKNGSGGDAGEYSNYTSGCMGQLGSNGIGAGPNSGANYSMNVGGGNGGGGNSPDGAGGGGGTVILQAPALTQGTTPVLTGGAGGVGFDGAGVGLQLGGGIGVASGGKGGPGGPPGGSVNGNAGYAGIVLTSGSPF